MFLRHYFEISDEEMGNFIEAERRVTDTSAKASKAKKAERKATQKARTLSIKAARQRKNRRRW